MIWPFVDFQEGRHLSKLIVNPILKSRIFSDMNECEGAEAMNVDAQAGMRMKSMWCHRPVILLMTLVVVVTTAQTAFSEGPEFLCYSAVNYPVQAYRYTDPDCGNAQDSEKFLCVHNAACRILTAEEVKGNLSKKTKKLTVSEVQQEILKGVLKPSFLVCRGRDIKQEGGDKARCPDVNECRRSVFYDFVPGGVGPETPATVLVPGKPGEKLQ